MAMRVIRPFRVTMPAEPRGGRPSTGNRGCRVWTLGDELVGAKNRATSEWSEAVPERIQELDAFPMQVWTVCRQEQRWSKRGQGVAHASQGSRLGSLYVHLDIIRVRKRSPLHEWIDRDRLHAEARTGAELTHVASMLLARLLIGLV